VSAEVRLEPAGSVGWIVFDHPERRNALTASMMRDALDALDKVSQEETIRVVVLRGAGDASFISGADITAFGSQSGVDRGPRPEDVTSALARLDKPVIAALKGWCLGAGVMLAMAADLRVAGDDLRIGIPAAKLGIAYPRDGIDRIVALAGPAVAAEMLMLAEPYDADGARLAGLVNRVVPAAALWDEVGRMADALAANAPLTLAASKLTIDSVQRPYDAPAADAAASAISRCYGSEDFREGQRAFVEKRPPDFQGR
jgi:enoyl-CoA hydratase